MSREVDIINKYIIELKRLGYKKEKPKKVLNYDLSNFSNFFEFNLDIMLRGRVKSDFPVKLIWEEMKCEINKLENKLSSINSDYLKLQNEVRHLNREKEELIKEIYNG